MTEDEAKTCLDDSTQKPSKHGEATDILYQKYGSYKRVAGQVKRGSVFLSKVHAVFKLPKGIQQQVNKRKISTSQAKQIHGLKNEEDKWLFAIEIVEKNIKADECKNIIKQVKDNKSIKEALSVVSGIQFHEGNPLLLTIPPEFRIPITKLAWGQGQEWADICYQLVRQGLEVNIRDVATQLEAITSEIENSIGTRK